jgi:hypothetical protein
MRLRDKFPLLTVLVVALAPGLAGLTGAGGLSPPVTLAAQVEHVSRGGSPTKRASQGRK